MFRHVSCIIYITQIIFFNSYFVLIMDFSHYYILYCISINLHPCALIGFFHFLHHFFFALALHSYIYDITIQILLDLTCVFLLNQHCDLLHRKTFINDKISDVGLTFQKSEFGYVRTRRYLYYRKHTCTSLVQDHYVLRGCAVVVQSNCSYGFYLCSQLKVIQNTNFTRRREERLLATKR